MPTPATRVRGLMLLSCLSPGLGMCVSVAAGAWPAAIPWHQNSTPPAACADQRDLVLHQLDDVQAARPAVLLAPIVAGPRPQPPRLPAEPVLELEPRLAVGHAVADLKP